MCNSWIIPFRNTRRQVSLMHMKLLAPSSSFSWISKSFSCKTSLKHIWWMYQNSTRRRSLSLARMTGLSEVAHLPLHQYQERSTPVAHFQAKQISTCPLSPTSSVSFLVVGMAPSSKTMKSASSESKYAIAKVSGFSSLSWISSALRMCTVWHQNSPICPWVSWSE